MAFRLRILSTTAVFREGKELNHDGSLDKKIGDAKEPLTRTPWHREGADQPPVKRLRSAGAMTKGI
jgi:hypothetical protein